MISITRPATRHCAARSPAGRRLMLGVVLLAASHVALAQAQGSPFMTGATSLQTNILAWLTPIAVILVITSVHASSATLAFEQLTLLVKQSSAGSGLARRDIKSLLHLLIDVVIQCSVLEHRRVISEIWFDPSRRLRADSGRMLKALQP